MGVLSVEATYRPRSMSFPALLEKMGKGGIYSMICTVMALQKAIPDNCSGFELLSPAAAGIYVAIVLNHPS
jgi:hypothetical protein